MYNPDSSTNSYKRLRIDPKSALPDHRNDELLIILEDGFTQNDIDCIKSEMRSEKGIDCDCIEEFKLRDTSLIQLWKAKNIHTFTHGDSVKVVKNATPRTVGSATLNLNIKINDKVKWSIKGNANKEDINNESSTDTIVIAVLDTGINPDLISDKYLWKNKNEEYGNEKYGYNCISDQNETYKGLDDKDPYYYIRDDSKNLHGTLVSQFILNEFKHANPGNKVELMILKTHDKNGDGNLFNILKAIDYAIENGADIINASWGFYSYDDALESTLKRAITKRLKKKGVLFITASGNEIKEVDIQAAQLFKSKNPYGKMPNDFLRNLDKHVFIPACFSDINNNIITVTTSGEESVTKAQSTPRNFVAKSQNFSKNFVDLAVLGDKSKDKTVEFRLPFPGTPEFIHGSSYATAIATGQIARNYKKCLPASNIKKTILESLCNNPKDLPVISIEPSLVDQIRGGRIIRNRKDGRTVQYK